jgi:hypothetical protein
MEEQKWKEVTRKEIEKGYEEQMGEKYTSLPKRDKDLLYERYRLIESSTKEYYRERQREKG